MSWEKPAAISDRHYTLREGKDRKGTEEGEKSQALDFVNDFRE